MIWAAPAPPFSGRKVEPTYVLARAIIKPFIATWLRYDIEGLENIPSRGPAIVAFNHIAYLDAFASAYAVDKAGRRPRFLAKSELFADKRIAWILKGAGQIEVRRGTRDAPMALDHALAALDEGEVVVIFPEGTITTNPDLKPMAARSGAARLALESGAPLIPAALWGTQNIWGKGCRKHWWPPRQDVLARIGEPLHLEESDSSPEAWRAVSARLMDEISVLVASLMPAVPDARRPLRRAA